jgi:hypothetical protein
MTKALYRTMAYGYRSGELFTRYGICTDRLGYAQGSYEALVGDPEYDGAVLIEGEGPTWRLVSQCGLHDHEVWQPQRGLFRIEAIA